MPFALRTALAFILCFATTAKAYADIKMGIFPRRSVKVTHQSFKPLAAHLTDALGEKVVLVVPKDFKTFWDDVTKGRYDLVHYNQYHYILSHEEFGYRVILANEENGKRTIAGALSVRTDSGVNGIEDLRGKSILFGGGKKAMASYLAPTAVLRAAGLTAGKDYTEAFAKNPPAAAIGMANKAADAAGTGNVALKLKAVTKRVDPKIFKVVAESESFVQLPWAVKADVTETKAEKIRAAMIATPEVVLKSAKVTGFFPVTDADFDKVREIADYALGK